MSIFTNKIRSAIAIMATGGFLATSPANAQKADNNPDLPVQCGLDIVLVLDASGSIKYSNDPAVQDDKNGSIDRVASAADAFLNAFSNTNSRVAVVSYSHDSIEQTNYADVNPGSIAAGGIHSTSIGDAGGLAGPVPAGTTGYAEHASKGGSTNWEAAMMSTRDMLSGATGNSPRDGVPRLVVHITDGQPTSYIDPNTNSPTTGNSTLALNNAVAIAQDIMGNHGAHMYTVGVGGAASHVDKLEQMSGPDVYNQGTGQTFDASTTDVILASDFAQLETLLAGFATELCAPSLTITNLVSEPQTPDTYDVAGGWDFAAKPTASDNTYSWVLPEATPAVSKTSTTDNNGRVQFQWQLEDAVNWAPGMINVTQTQKNGYDNMTAVECFRTNRSVTNQPFTANYESTTGKIDVTVEADDIVTCEVLNRANQRDTGTVPPTRNHWWWAERTQAMTECMSENGGSFDLGIFEIRDESFDDEIDAYSINNGQIMGDADIDISSGLDLAMGLLMATRWEDNAHATTKRRLKAACVSVAKKMVIATCNNVWQGAPLTVDLDQGRSVLEANCDASGSKEELTQKTEKLQEMARSLRKYNGSGKHIDVVRDGGPVSAYQTADDPFYAAD